MGLARATCSKRDYITRGITSPTIRREMRRRSAIEPVIGHLKGKREFLRTFCR